MAAWFLRQVGLQSDELGVFTDRLLTAFQSGLPVNHPADGQWYATLDAIDSEDNQVAAVVRLSRRRPDGTRKVRRGMVDVEERNRTLFAEPTSTASPASSDLLVTYSFPLLFSLERNLELFREFAGKELGRLRTEVASKD